MEPSSERCAAKNSSSAGERVELVLPEIAGPEIVVLADLEVEGDLAKNRRERGRRRPFIA